MRAVAAGRTSRARLEIFAELPRTAGGKLSKVTLRSEVVERMAAR